MTDALKHCLLVVDDEPDLVDSVKDLLRREYRVLGATRASEGLRLMAQEKVHIVMSDQRMPGMTGVEFLAELKEKYPHTVRLLFTAYADIKAVVDAINQGSVYRYITKPWHPHDLQVVLRQAAQHYDLLEDRRRLMAELRARNEELKAANEGLQQANELKKAFIKVASHELRTPMTIVMGLAELSCRTEGLGPPHRDWVERIYQGSCRLNERIDQMIKLLMADRYDVPLARSAVDVGELLQSAARDIRTFIERRGQTLEVRVEEPLGTVHAEESKIRDCVQQLLINAIKFTPDGGHITLSGARAADGSVEIRVADTGVGIEPASLARVFDPFFTRFDVSTHCSGVYEFDRRGLGLGLSVVKAFVEMHGGQVRVRSEPGQGSEFTIVLPAARPLPAPPAADYRI